MTNQTFLTFSVHGLLLAVHTDMVREIDWLPELTVLEEYPSSIARCQVQKYLTDIARDKLPSYPVTPLTPRI